VVVCSRVEKTIFPSSKQFYMSYTNILAQQTAENHFVCLGLDPVVSKIPGCLKSSGRTDPEVVWNFLYEIINETGDIVTAFKPNFAFFEALGSEGYAVLEDLAVHVAQYYPNVLFIGDAKRGDIGNTNTAYMKSFENFNSFTIAPYLGGEANAPFFADKNKLVFVLCQTSNPGAAEFQGTYTLPFDPHDRPAGVTMMDWLLKINKEVKPMYQYVAQQAIGWAENVGLVTGATYPQNIKKVREIIGDDRWLLVPGIGAQGGDLKATVCAAGNTHGQNFIINTSSAALYASSDEDFAKACRKVLMKLNKDIDEIRSENFKTA
jgi:orotidine-5'-phosphate decarboxylase